MLPIRRIAASLFSIVFLASIASAIDDTSVNTSTLSWKPFTQIYLDGDQDGDGTHYLESYTSTTAGADYATSIGNAVNHYVGNDWNLWINGTKYFQVAPSLTNVYTSVTMGTLANQRTLTVVGQIGAAIADSGISVNWPGTVIGIESSGNCYYNIEVPNTQAGGYMVTDSGALDGGLVYNQSAQRWEIYVEGVLAGIIDSTGFSTTTLSSTLTWDTEWDTRDEVEAVWAGTAIIWCDDNDGPGSTLDSDTVDGIQGAEIFEKDGSVDATGNFQMEGYWLTSDGTESGLLIANASTLSSPIFSVWSGNSGVSSAYSTGILAVENSTDALIWMETPTNKKAGLVASDTNDSFEGGLLYDHAATKWEIYVEGSVVATIDATGLVGGADIVDIDTIAELEAVLTDVTILYNNTDHPNIDTDSTNDAVAASTLTDNAIVRGDGGTRGVQTSLVTISDAGDMTLLDNDKMLFGTGGDAEIYSDGANLVIRALTADEDILFYCNDGGVDTPILIMDASSPYLKSYAGTFYLNALNSNTASYLQCYDDGAGFPQIRLFKSDQDTEGYAETDNNDILGVIYFYGVGSNGASRDQGANITVIQDGAAGATNVPTEMIFVTSSSSGINSNQLFLDGPTGNVGIGTAAPTAPLMVKSDATHYGIRIEENSGSEYMTMGVAANGKFQISDDDTDVIFQLDDGAPAGSLLVSNTGDVGSVATISDKDGNLRDTVSASAQSSNFVLTPAADQGNISYRFTPGDVISISSFGDGDFDGQVIRITCIDSVGGRTITVSDAAGQCELGAATRVLGNNDNLTLEWDSTNSTWREIAYADN